MNFEALQVAWAWLVSHPHICPLVTLVTFGVQQMELRTMRKVIEMRKGEVVMLKKKPREGIVR